MIRARRRSSFQGGTGFLTKTQEQEPLPNLPVRSSCDYAGTGQPIKFPYGNRMVSASFRIMDAAEHSGEHYG